MRLLVTILLLGAVARGAAAQCSDPCLQTARADYRACNSSATGAFQEALDGCLERDHACVDACRWSRGECVGATGLGVAVASCDAEQDAATDACTRRFPHGLRRLRCVYRAQIAGARCRRTARRTFRGDRRACDDAFDACAAGCGAGGPPDGADACRASARAAARAVLADCRQVLQVTSAACFDKEPTCVQDCGTARIACDAPTQDALAAALAACAGQVQSAVAACQAANPGGGAALDECVETAQAAGTACADDAVAAAAPGIAACVPPFVGCVRSCPKESR